MIVNIMHRPASGQLYDMFRLQQSIAHELGLKTTIMVPYDFMLDARTVADVRADAERYGDEVGIWLGETTTEHLAQKVGCKEAFLWLLNKEAKQRVLREVLGKFREVFGYAPASFAAYHMDAYSLRLLKELCPQIKISVAGCFEEGVKVFHGCNNSWYLFNEGMPFAPWYPAKENSLRPAQNADDWCGVVAVPHLSRDLALSYEGRNDFFASHPANVQRAMANRGADAPYVLNLLDVYRFQERFNNGFSYTNVFVGPNWLYHSPNVQDCDEITQGLYREYLSYFAALREEGHLVDMHMSEFADWFVQNVPPSTPQIFDAKEILYGSGKDYIWYCDSEMRVTFDLCQGGSIGDLRPFVARQPRNTGADMPQKAYGSNPYVIHSQYRTGNAHHFSDGARTTLLVSNGCQTLDLCDYPTSVQHLERLTDGMRLILSPVVFRFDNEEEVTLHTEILAKHGGQIIWKRKFVNLLGCSVLTATEYLKGCWGITEYPEDMTNIELRVGFTDCPSNQTLKYTYEGRSIRVNGMQPACASIGPLKTELMLIPQDGDFLFAQADEGYLFNPYYTLYQTASVTNGKEMVTNLCLKKII